MSLVSTYVRATNGYLYKNPILSGQGWFICFDDEDPVEIVLQFTKKDNTRPLLKQKALKILKEININYSRLTNSGRSKRMYNGEFKESYAFFFQIRNRVNSEFITKHDGKFKKQQGQGVYYDFKK